MGIQGIIKFLSTQTTKARPLLYALMELMHIGECLLDCAMHLLHFNDA
jgi:hypothetical protein